MMNHIGLQPGVLVKWLSGWQRFVPLLCGFWFPIGMVAMVAFGDE